MVRLVVVRVLVRGLVVVLDVAVYGKKEMRVAMGIELGIELGW